MVLGEPRRTLIALFVTLKLELVSQFLCKVLGRDLTWTRGTFGVNRDL